MTQPRRRTVPFASAPSWTQPANGSAVRTEACPIADFPYDDEPYRRWHLSLRHQVHGSRREARKAEFLGKTNEVTEQLARLVNVAELGRLVAAMGGDTSAIAFSG